MLAAGLAVVPAVADTPASLVGAGGAGGASGAGAVTTLEQLVGKLNSESIAERQAAGESISSNGSFTLPDLEAILRKPGLPVESRLRLLPIARARFDEQPRTALGVEFDLSTSRSVIRRTIATFPAHGILQPGDEIVSVAGQRVATTTEGRDGRGLQQFNGRFVNQWGINPIRPHIVCRDPGTKVRMQIIRRGPESLVMNNGRNFVQGPNGQLIIEPDFRPGANKPDPDPIELEVPLGRFSDLANTQPLTAWDLAEAWRLRTASFAPGAEEEPISSGLGASDYGIPSLSDADRRVRLEQRARAGQVIPLSAGGEGGAGEPTAAEANLGRNSFVVGGFDQLRNGIQINNGNIRAQIRIGVGGEVIDLTPMGERPKADGKGGQALEQLDAMIRTADVMSREVEDYDQKLREPAIDDITRRRLETARQAAKDRLARYLTNIDAAKAKVLQGDK